MSLVLGNLVLRPAAGLLFPDWCTGTALHVYGRARVRLVGGAGRRPPRAGRVVLFTVTDVVKATGMSPLRWNAPEYSRVNPPPGWPDGSGRPPRGRVLQEICKVACRPRAAESVAG
jgi:hypothetical protein